MLAELVGGQAVSDSETREADKAKKAVLNRLRRARGQLDALIASLDQEADCRQTIIQLAAVSKALDKAGYAIISSAMRECLTPTPGGDEETLTPEELEKLFMMLS